MGDLVSIYDYEPKSRPAPPTPAKVLAFPLFHRRLPLVDNPFVFHSSHSNMVPITVTERPT